ncbi:MAG: glycosyltransferase family 39 protein [Phycisphaerales bacterium]
MTEDVRKHRRTWIALLALTVIGAGLRFYRMDRPTLWGDEVATYQRVLGSFDQLMARLRGEGFVPLHYVCTWALGKAVLLTPGMMRLGPALCGTLFIPAIYLLTRQMFDRRVSLAAAALATSSAFGMTYSRDAKMYMQTWFFVTMFAGLLLLWWRTRNGPRKGRWREWLLWLGWVLCGTAGVMFHATALLVVGLSPLFVAVMPAPGSPAPGSWWRRTFKVLMLVVGLAVVVVPPGVYYLRYNTYIEKTAIVPMEGDENGHANWKKSGLDWVAEFNRGIGPWELAANSAANYLLGVQWPRQAMDPKGFPGPMPGWFGPACVWAMTGVLGLMGMGAGRIFDFRFSIGDLRTGDPGQAEDGMAGLGCQIGNRKSEIDNPRNWWHRSALLSAWLILPSYGVFYCRSFTEAVSPWGMVAAMWGWLGWGWLLVGAATAGLAMCAAKRRRVGWAVTGLWWMLLIGTLGWAMIGGGAKWGVKWIDWMAGHRWMMGAMVASGATAWWWRLGESVKERNRRLWIGCAIAAGLFVLCGGAWWGWHMMAERYAAAHGGKAWQSIWMPRYLGVVYPAVLVVSAAMFMRLPRGWMRWGAVGLWVGLNLTQGLARVEADTEPPFDVAGRDAWVVHEDKTVGLVLDAFDQPVPGAFQSRERVSYYLDMSAGKMESKEDFDRGARLREVQRLRRPNEQRLKQYLESHTGVRKLIVWERFGPDKTAEQTDEGAMKTLGAEWTMTEKTIYRTRQFWTWREGLWYRRMVYEKENF